MEKKIESLKSKVEEQKHQNNMKKTVVKRQQISLKAQRKLNDRLIRQNTMFETLVSKIREMIAKKLSLNVFIAYIKQGVGPQVFPTLVTALPLQSTYIKLNGDIYSILKYRICRYDDK